MTKTRSFHTLISAFLLTACAGSTTIMPPDFITATLPATNTAGPASTQMSPTSQMVPSSPTSEVLITQQTVEGVTTTQLNLRSEPSTAGETLGTVAAFSTIQIIGKESYGRWYQISDSAFGRGWIIASYVQTADAGLISMIDLGASGLVIQGVNVRSGANQDTASLGTLVANDVVTLIGRDANSNWLQINFKGSTGWVAAEFVQVNHVEVLPVVADQGEENSTSAPIDPGIPSSSMQDHDSLEVPLATLTLHPSGAGGLQSNGFINSATGDETDWIQFTTFDAKVSIQVICSSNDMQLDVYENKSILQESFLKCNEIKTLNTVTGQPYTLKLQANAETPNPIQYSVLIKIVK